jgi:hypothetical protein
MWLRAFRGTHYTSPVLKSMDLWEIGVLLDGDIGDPAPRIVIDPEPVDPNAPKPSGPRLRNVD